MLSSRRGQNKQNKYLPAGYHSEAPNRIVCTWLGICARDREEERERRLTPTLLRSKALLCRPPRRTCVPSRHSECTGMTSPSFARHLQLLQLSPAAAAALQLCPNCPQNLKVSRTCRDFEVRAHGQKCFLSRPEPRACSSVCRHLRRKT